MSDVLSFTVPTFPLGDTSYPSANKLIGRVRGRKPPSYHALRNAVAEAAREEMKRVGWETATYYCEVYWRRYMPNLRARLVDSQNAGIPECNGLADAGVVANDSLIQWHPGIVQYDPSSDAIDRITITVMRNYPPAILAEKASNFSASRSEAQKRTAKKRAGDTALVSARALRLEDLRSGDVVPPHLIQALFKKGSR